MPFKWDSMEPLEERRRLESSIRTHILELKFSGKDLTNPYPSGTPQAEIWDKQKELIEKSEHQEPPISHEWDG